MATIGEKATNYLEMRRLVRGACIAERYKTGRPTPFFFVHGAYLTMEQWVITPPDQTTANWHEDHMARIGADAIQKIGEQVAAAIVQGNSGFFSRLIQEIKSCLNLASEFPEEKIGEIAIPSYDPDPKNTLKITKRAKDLRLVESCFKRVKAKNPKRLPYYEELLDEIEKVTNSREGQAILGKGRLKKGEQALGEREDSDPTQGNILRAIKALGLHSLPQKPKILRI